MSARHLLFLLPLVILAGLTGAFLWGLDPSRDPNAIPPQLLDRPAPDFALPALGQGEPSLTTADLATGEPVLVNLFASWCAPCRAEHALLMALRDRGYKIYGINYRDQRAAAEDWLAELGNPYAAIGFDGDGAAALAWGITGVPETFILDGAGTIRFRIVGPLYPQTLETEVLPLLEALSQ